MNETRHQFREDLKEIERQTLEGLDLVVAQLDQALEALSDHNLELAAIVIAADARIDRRYIEVHQCLLSLLARQAPVAGDLRMIGGAGAHHPLC
jgi:phosphate transport system protein